MLTSDNAVDSWNGDNGSGSKARSSNPILREMIRSTYPELRGREIDTAGENLLRYFEIALAITEEVEHMSVDNSKPIPTIKERSNLNLKT